MAQPPPQRLRLLPVRAGRRPRRVIDARPRDPLTTPKPHYACGHCGALALAGRPLIYYASDADAIRSTGVQCRHCGEVSVLQVTSQRVI